jgi:hypothetical protein
VNCSPTSAVSGACICRREPVWACSKVRRTSHVRWPVRPARRTHTHQKPMRRARWVPQGWLVDRRSEPEVIKGAAPPMLQRPLSIVCATASQPRRRPTDHPELVYLICGARKGGPRLFRRSRTGLRWRGGFWAVCPACSSGRGLRAERSYSSVNTGENQAGASDSSVPTSSMLSGVTITITGPACATSSVPSRARTA